MTNKIISRFRDFHGAKKKYAFTVAAITILCMVTILYSPSVAFARGSNTWPQREGYYMIPQKKAMPYYWGEEKIDSKLTHEDVKVNKSNESLVNNELNRGYENYNNKRGDIQYSSFNKFQLYSANKYGVVGYLLGTHYCAKYMPYIYSEHTSANIGGTEIIPS